MSERVLSVRDRRVGLQVHVASRWLGQLAVIFVCSVGRSATAQDRAPLRLAEPIDRALRVLQAPQPPSVNAPDVDQETAVRIAQARARWEWGDAARLGSVIPLYNLDGDVCAYDVDFTIDGSAFGTYSQVASEWRAFCEARFVWQQERLKNKGDAPAVPWNWRSPRYASVTVSATYDAPPIRGSRPGVSGFYASGGHARAVAEQVLGEGPLYLSRVLFDGSWERMFEFTNGSVSIAVQGYEPWGWYATQQLRESIRKLWDDRRATTVQDLTAAGQDADSIVQRLRNTNAERAARWVEGDTLRGGPTLRSAVYITGYNTYFTPYYWFGGCSPTSGSMVLNYYDEIAWYGNITKTYSRQNCPVTGNHLCHASDMQVAMCACMQIDANGFVHPYMIYGGMVQCANNRGYCFSGGSDWNGGVLDWHWTDIVNDIDNDHPFVFSCYFYPGAGGVGHSVAVVGYDPLPSPAEVLCYNTWESGSIPERCPHSGGLLDSTYGDGPYPGCPIMHDVKVLSPDGQQAYMFTDCLYDGTLTGGEQFTISWENFGSPADYVSISYSTDGGQSWSSLVSQTSDDESYTWQVPCRVSTSEARIRIEQYAGGALVASDSSYGDFRIEVPGVLGPPALQTPSNGATCQGTSGTLDWSDVSGASGYRVQIGTTCGSGSEYDVTSSQYPYSGLQGGTTYYWRVRTKNACGNYGSYSGCFSFTTDAGPLSAPSLQSPSNGATCQGTSGTLDWSDVSGASGYRVQIGTSCGSGSEYDVTSSQYPYSGLQGGTTYYWRVRTKNACANYGSYSGCYSFATDPGGLPAPSLQSPSNGASCQGTSGTVDWSDVIGASGYRVQIGTSCGSGSEYDVTSSQYSYSGLQGGTTYYWRVRTKNACANYGSYSDCFSFAAAPGVLPIQNITTGAVYCTIQAGIDEASNGDEIVLSPGTYTGDGNRDIDFNGKAITVRSTNPEDPAVVAATIIDCGGSYGDHRGFVFQSGEGPSSVVAGVTITGGWTSDDGGAIEGGGLRPTISKCIIRGNSAHHGGGIAHCHGPITDCQIEGNTAVSSGGGLYDCDGAIAACVIADNQVAYAFGYGGGLYGCDGTIENCAITGNANNHPFAKGGGLASCQAKIRDCLITGNSARGDEDSAGGAGYGCGGAFVNCRIADNGSAVGGGCPAAAGLWSTAPLPRTVQTIRAAGLMDATALLSVV